MTIIKNEGTAGVEDKVIEVLKNCFDPEIPVNIYELGLVYNIDIDPQDVVTISMTLTSPMCPVAETLPPTVEARVRNIDGVTDARVAVTWEPPWGPDKMTDAAKLTLNMM
ncbi:MAG TPA: iron-sulfur cluster assembly protein [Patescibacteria group bacterium]|jgi:FeS assembly SUF system protein|nr:iron-sulfur cluster assembly protein [Patescibacteria group bacterium]